MLSLFLILILVAISLTVVLWAGTFFFQGYIYTEPSPGIFWQAPAAAALLTFGYAIWSLALALASPTSPSNLVVNPIFFSPNIDMFDRPAPKIVAIKKNLKKSADKDGEKVIYEIKRDNRGRPYYADKSVKPHLWQSEYVIAIEIEKDGAPMRFDLMPTEEHQFRQFRSRDGWVITEYGEGPTGIPVRFSLWRLIVNVFFNLGHFVGWFIGLWLILRFQWMHALGLAAALWIIVTLTFLPMILGFAAEVSSDRQGVKTVAIELVRPLSV